MLSLFADQEREAKLDRLGDPLALFDKNVGFATQAPEIDHWAPGSGGTRAVGHLTRQS